jgi:flagellar biogenesis protein FliO
MVALFRVFGALALVLGVFFAGLWVWRNWQRFFGPRGLMPKLSIVEAKSLGQRHTLYVVGYEEQRMLLAASPTGVTMLTALPAAKVEMEKMAPQPEPSGPSNFGALLLHAIRQRS